MKAGARHRNSRDRHGRLCVVDDIVVVVRPVGVMFESALHGLTDVTARGERERHRGVAVRQVAPADRHVVDRRLPSISLTAVGVAVVPFTSKSIVSTFGHVLAERHPPGQAVGVGR